MCGIVGYIGPQDASPILLEGLGRLEYRGYDSAGVAVVSRNGLKIHKSQGRVADLNALLPARFKGAPGGSIPPPSVRFHSNRSRNRTNIRIIAGPATRARTMLPVAWATSKGMARVSQNQKCPQVTSPP